MMQDYERYRANKIESGQAYQDFIVDQLAQRGLAVVVYASRTYQYSKGESRCGVEIKHDEMFAKTGNLWIEVAEKARPRAGNYAPSGIHRADNSWLYVIGNYDIAFGFGKRDLQALWASGRYPLRENYWKTSQAFWLREPDITNRALFVLTPNAEQTISGPLADMHALGRFLYAEARRDPAQSLLFETEMTKVP